MIYITENYSLLSFALKSLKKKIILLGLTCNFIFVPHFVKWIYLKITATTIGKVFTTGRISD